MIMKQVNLLVFASLCCLVSSAPQVYYVTPTKPDPQGSCHVKATTLHPCYTLKQLNGVLSSPNGSVEVLLLPGTHLISKKETLKVFNFSEVVIRPWKEELEMTIKCIPSKHHPTNIQLQNIIKLEILSFRFSSCKLQYGYEMNSKTERSVNITKSVFENSTLDIRSSESNLNVTVSNCTFSLSNKGTLFMLPPGYDETLPHYEAKRITIGNLQIADTLFHDNRMDSGTIFQVVYSNLVMYHCSFRNNSIESAGDGIIYVFSSSLILKNTAILHSRTMWQTDSSLHLRDSSGTIDACLFSNNSADNGGALYIENSLLSISNCIFEGNRCTALHISTCTLRLAVSNCTFRNNTGSEGGALHVEKCEDVVVFNSSFSFNKALYNRAGGGAIYCVDSTIATSGAIYSSSNSADNGGYAYFSNCRFEASDGGYYCNNEASNGGAIFAERGTIITFNYNATITSNFAYNNGGAFYLDTSEVYINASSDPLILSNNAARLKGGAIFIQDTNCDRLRCFIQALTHDLIVLNFKNNTAPQGPVLYGGLLDRCNPGIDVLKSISSYKHTPEVITSDPVRICFCTENHELDCTTRNLTVSDKSTGQIINLLGTVVDQDNNPKASYIRAGYNETTAELGKGEGRRETGKNCSKLLYHIFTRNHSATLILQPESICMSSNFSSITVYIEVKSCPRGFEQNDDRCECDNRLSNRFKGIVCDINADTITTK